MDQRTKKRLREKIEINPDTDCWEWQGNLTKDGYGRVTIAGKNCLVHRVMYEIANGPIPANLEIDHLCHNKRCCNPKHLEPVPHAVNMRRARERGTWAGERNPRAQYTDLTALQIKQQRRLLKKPYAELMELFGGKEKTLARIASRGTWKHLEWIVDDTQINFQMLYTALFQKAYDDIGEAGKKPGIIPQNFRKITLRMGAMAGESSKNLKTSSRVLRAYA